MEETAAPATPAAPRSIGERLRAGRERAGLSVAAAAEKLHLDAKVIEALEADRFADLGAPVYVRGHLRRYADFVGEPGAELVGSYTARDARPAPPDLTQVPHPDRRADPRRLVTPFVGLSCAAVLMVAIWWVLAGSQGGGVDPAATPAVQDSAVVADTPGTPDFDTGAVAPAPVAQAGTAGAVTSTPVVARAPAAETPVAQPRREAATDTSTAPVRETRLKLDLTTDSWVEVYDSRGERLFYDVASAGSVQSVSGRGPLRVVLGNAAGVLVEVDGQAREIPAGAIDGESARFVVNRSGSLTRAR
jgi:cytoskeleton protein RodZ